MDDISVHTQALNPDLSYQETGDSSQTMAPSDGMPDEDAALARDLEHGLFYTDDGDDGMFEEPDEENGAAVQASPVPDEKALQANIDKIVADHTHALTRRYERGLAVGMHWAGKLEEACGMHAALRVDEARYDPETYAEARARAEQAEMDLSMQEDSTVAEERAANEERAALRAEEAALAARKAELAQAQERLRRLQDELRAQDEENAETAARWKAEKADLALHVRDIQKDTKNLLAQAEKWAALRSAQTGDPAADDAVFASAPAAPRTSVRKKAPARRKARGAV